VRGAGVSAATCSGPGKTPDDACGRPAVAHGLCVGHGQQRRRGRPLKPLRAPLESAAPVPVRLDAKLREMLDVAAAHAGVSLAMYLRDAGSERILRQCASDVALRRKMARHLG
jgi:hypothetical protein